MATHGDTNLEMQPQPRHRIGPGVGGEEAGRPTGEDSFAHALADSAVADAGVPDGGVGWAVVAGCSAITWWTVGLPYSWGIIQNVLVQRGLAGPSTLAFIGSLAVACISALAILNAQLIRIVGARPTALAGVTLIGVGEFLGGFTVDNLGGLFVTAGVIVGVGISLCFMAVSVTPAQYFNKRRGLANGIVYAGGGFGGAVLSLAMNSLNERLGPAWTFRTLGLLALATGLPAAWWVRDRVAPTKTKLVEWRFFRDPHFVVLFFGSALATFALFVPPFFLPLYCDSLGLSAGKGAALVAGFNFASALGRIGSGLLGDRIGPLNTLFLALFLGALSMLILWPISTTLGPLIAFVVINGAANGGFFASMPTVVGTVFGSTRITVALGMIITGWIGGYLMGAPIAGYILNAYGGPNKSLDAYHPAIFYAGSMLLGASGLVMSSRLMTSKSLRMRL